MERDIQNGTIIIFNNLENGFEVINRYEQGEIYPSSKVSNQFNIEQEKNETITENEIEENKESVSRDIKSDKETNRSSIRINKPKSRKRSSLLKRQITLKERKDPTIKKIEISK